MAEKVYAGFGRDTLVPRLRPVPMAALKLDADAGFVLSRVDGKSTVAQICLLVPFEATRTIAILTELVRAGAVEVPGSEVLPDPIPLPGPPSPSETLPKAPRPPSPSQPIAVSPSPSPSQPIAIAPRERVPTPVVAGLELSVEQARRIDEFFGALEERDAFELLEVARGADKKEIKRAYFRMSKEFHPDRFFNKNIGPYKERLSKIFQSVKAAFELLSDDARRAAYEESSR